ncbi:hypothetical protein MD484_g1937, partial [Candolleomyces efflorescens]
MKSLALRATISAVCAYVAVGHPTKHNSTVDVFDNRATQTSAPPNCFPAIGFKMPNSVPSSLNNWWCEGSTEYAFMGFSYETTAYIYKSRRDALFNILKSNSKAKFVTRVVQFGSEPLYDWAIYAADLANERKDDGSMDVLKAVDFVDAHMLPFFSQQASTVSDLTAYWGKNPEWMALGHIARSSA